jgi:hypothetical protein
VIYRITDNRIGAPTLLETTSGHEAMSYAVCLNQFRLYRDGKNVAVGFTQGNLLTMRSDSVLFPTFDSHFED